MESSIVEAREESMVSPTVVDSIPTTRTAHFLKPTISSFIAAPINESPTPHNSSEPSKLNASFQTRKSGGAANWKLWVENIAAIHKPTWEKAGIFDAVMSSVYQIRRDEELVYRLAEKWCPRTNSFVFQWGEATVTLEDMAVFGFSVSGSPVFLPLEEEEEEEEQSEGIKRRLETAMKELRQSKLKKAAISSWISKFRGSESPIEHEAFLVAWLSTYVLANTMDSIRKETIPIAIHLSRGTRIALAPSVLSSIYRHLSILKSLIVQSRESKGNSDDACFSAGLWRPFQLVQVWAWERFPQMQPLPEKLGRWQPRLARWSMKERKDSGEEEVSVVLDSAADDFIWRPYALPLSNWDFAKFYGEEARWVLLKSGSDDEDLVDLARCVRVSSLVGMDSIEKYFPHRVAMQFGFDQDIPGDCDSNESCQIDAWRDYCTDLGGVRLYVPPRLFEADVTTRYQQWWKQQVVELQRIELQSLGNNQKKRMGKKRAPKRAANGVSSSGHLPKITVMSYKNVKRNKADDPEDQMTIAELLKAEKKRNGAEDGNSSVEPTVNNMVLETQQAERRRKKQNDGYESSPDHTPLRGPDSTVAAELRESGMNNGTSAMPNAAAATTPVIKLEPVEEGMMEVGENENQGNTHGAMGDKEIDLTIARIEDHLRYIKKKLGLH
ncbi:Protein MAINTENANCE OF MERISTEMS [Linum grandiflorum]